MQRIADSISKTVQTQLLDVEAAGWDESAHPRDATGKWSSGGGSTAGKRGGGDDPRSRASVKASEAQYHADRAKAAAAAAQQAAPGSDHAKAAREAAELAQGHADNARDYANKGAADGATDAANEARNEAATAATRAQAATGNPWHYNDPKADTSDPRDQPGKFVRGDAHAVAESYRMRAASSRVGLRWRMTQRQGEYPSVPGDRQYWRRHADGSDTVVQLHVRGPVTGKGSAHHYSGWTLYHHGGVVNSGSQRASLERALHQHKQQLGVKW
jgi:hypothetical protein